ncbi:MAG: DUF3987 domain-containing protein [Planctomycetes bacterium]|nr:DUF3987 domain-containing protein [Planctomycetota bacterium]
MTPTERILVALRDHGLEPKKAGEGWACRCPAHDDRNPSLSIHMGDDGRVLLNCHAGCTLDAVCDELGIKKADLFPRRADGHTCAIPRRRTDTDITPRNPAYDAGSVSVGNVGESPTYPTARDAVSALERQYGPYSAMWTYTDAEGVQIGQVLRWDTPTGKLIRPVSKNCTGWRIGGMAEPRPIYALPGVLAAPAGSRVYVGEGEKTVDAARACGLNATTSPHGSKSATKADWSPIAGYDVVILPDHDDAGEYYAADVARLATKAGARSVRIARLVDLWPDLPEGGDFVDLLQHRGGDAEALRAEVEGLADAAEPVKQDAIDAPLGWRPFTVDALPEPLRRFVREVAKAFGCDASFVALPALGVAAGAIGNTCRIIVKSGWTEPSNLWLCPVGESGTLKSPAFKIVVRCTRKAQQRAIEEHGAAMKDYENEKLRHERDKARWKDQGCVGDAPVAPEPPTLRRLIVSDVTIEALAVILAANPRGVLLARDELAAMIGGFDRYAAGGRGSDAANWLSIYDGEALCVDRKSGTSQTIYVPSASASVIGTTQPGTLARLFSTEHRESGLLARFLLAMPPSKPALWNDADISTEAEARFTQMIDNLLALVPGVDEEGQPRPRLIGMTDAAKALFIDWHNRHAREMAELTGDLAAAFSKIKGACARLALVIHCCRVGGEDETLADAARIDFDSVQSAIILAQWFKGEARRVYAIFEESDDDKVARQLVAWIERKGGTATVRDLMRGGPCLKTADDAEAALDELVKAGRGRWEAQAPGRKGGRPIQRFRLTDGADTDTTAIVSGVLGGSVSAGNVSDANPKSTDSNEDLGAGCSDRPEG